MIAIPSKNFAFIHIPKTAGTSVSEIIRDKETDKIVDVSPTLKKHPNQRKKWGGHPKREVLEDLFPEFKEAEHTFAIVRNPYDRLLSAFLHSLRDRGYAGSFYPEYFNFEYWLHDNIEKNSLWTLPQTTWLNIEKDTIMKFEELEHDLYKMEDILGYKFKLGLHNESMKRIVGITHHNDVIRDSAKELIKKHYAEEIEIFNYEKICK